MCSVLAGLTALSTVMQVRSQQQQANAQANMYRAQADAAEQNARIENRKQEQIADNYAQQSRQLRSRQRLAEGSQRAETGAAGLGFTGSAMDILSSGLSAYQQDQENNLWNQRNDNYNSRQAEANYLTQAANARSAAANVKKAARGQMLGTILGGAASIYGMRDGGKIWGASFDKSKVGDVTTSVGHNTAATFSPTTGKLTFASTLPKDAWGRSYYPSAAERFMPSTAFGYK